MVPGSNISRNRNRIFKYLDALSSDPVGPRSRRISRGRFRIGERRGTQGGDPLAQRSADPLLISPAGAGRA